MTFLYVDRYVLPLYGHESVRNYEGSKAGFDQSGPGVSRVLVGSYIDKTFQKLVHFEKLRIMRERVK